MECSLEDRLQVSVVTLTLVAAGTHAVAVCDESVWTHCCQFAICPESQSLLALVALEHLVRALAFFILGTLSQTVVPGMYQ